MKRKPGFAVRLGRAIVFPLKLAIAVVLLLDSAARPIYRPLVEKLYALPFFEHMERAISRMPRFAILFTFAIPFIIAEPMKVVSLIMVAKGFVISGIASLILSYVVTFFFVERIYHAGRDKLLSYPWFAWFISQVVRVRNYMIAIKDRLVRRSTAFLRLAGLI